MSQNELEDHLTFALKQVDGTIPRVGKRRRTDKEIQLTEDTLETLWDIIGPREPKSEPRDKKNKWVMLATAWRKAEQRLRWEKERAKKERTNAEPSPTLEASKTPEPETKPTDKKTTRMTGKTRKLSS